MSGATAPPAPPRRRRPHTGLLAPATLVRTTKGRAVILALAIVTMVVEMGSKLVGVTVEVGSFPLSVSAVPSLILLAALGARASGEPGDRERLVPFWIAMAAGMALGWILFSATGDGIDVVALLVAATNEEVVFRFAVPLVVTSALMVIRFPSQPARVVGYVVGGAWWVLLPGHLAQVDGLDNLLTYVAFAVISALVVARSRALIPMSVAHCVLNIITVAALRGDIGPAGRGALSLCLLVLLVGTFAWPGDRVRPVSRTTPAEPEQDLITDTVIDLRDGQRPSVRHGDEISWIADPDGDSDDAPAAESDPATPTEGPRRR